jgi:ABC-type dipeptide/oligopeptide/nickel transport system permease subunit
MSDFRTSGTSGEPDSYVVTHETGIVTDDRDTISSGLLEMTRRNKLATFSFIIICLIIAAAMAAPLYAPYDPNRPSLRERFAPPSRAHWLGCDDRGRDWVLSSKDHTQQDDG